MTDKTIDIRMTWQGVAPLIATGIAAGGAAHAAALRELHVMARVADTVPTLLDALADTLRWGAESGSLPDHVVDAIERAVGAAINVKAGREN